MNAIYWRQQKFISAVWVYFSSLSGTSLPKSYLSSPPPHPNPPPKASSSLLTLLQPPNAPPTSLSFCVFVSIFIIITVFIIEVILNHHHHHIIAISVFIMFSMSIPGSVDVFQSSGISCIIFFLGGRGGGKEIFLGGICPRGAAAQWARTKSKCAKTPFWSL